jgi:hypothetical protein
MIPTNDPIKRMHRKGAIALFVYDAVVLLYALLTNQLAGAVIGTPVLLTISYFVLFIGLVSFLFSAAYVVTVKRYRLFGESVLLLLGAAVLLMLVLLLAIASS